MKRYYTAEVTYVVDEQHGEDIYDSLVELVTALDANFEGGSMKSEPHEPKAEEARDA